MFAMRRRMPARRGRGAKVLFALAGVTVLLFAAISLVDARIRPLVQQAAVARVNTIGIPAINDAINGKIATGAMDYSEIVHLEKDSEGKISALHTNMLVVNQLKADIISEVVEKITNTKTQELSIPLGNIVNGELLSGRGPDVPIRIVPVGSATAEFSNLFTSAGINQTRHQIMMKVTVSISVLLPGWTTATNVVGEIPVAETIIVGAVPETYTHFEDSTSRSEAERAEYLK